jgi:putative transposase
MQALYFVSYAVVNWVDVFIRNEYKQGQVQSWKYCQEHKGLDIYGWCIMPSHVHLIIGSDLNPLENIVRDMKRHTSEKMHDIIKKHS